MSQFVLDASIVLAWCFPDEHDALAQHVANRFSYGDSALVPSFWPHEVLNALLAGERRKRISSKLVHRFLVDLAVLPITMQEVPAKAVFGRVQLLSRQYVLTAYDAAYLDLALDRDLPIATLDHDLIAACKKTGAELIQS